MNTTVTREDRANAWTDENGVKYSADKRRLLRVPDDLQECVVADGCRVICDGAFAWCDALTCIWLPETITAVGENVFEDCRSLTSIIIPVGTMEAFESMLSREKTLLEEFDFRTDVTDKDLANAWVDEYGVKYSADKLRLLWVPDTLQEYKIKNGCKVVCDRAFTSISPVVGSNLAHVTIPNSVTRIGYGAFEGCVRLKSIVIPNSVKSIGYSAFQGCVGLTSVSMSNNVMRIENFVFYGCTGLAYISIPNSVTSIGEWVFANCTGLTSVSIPGSVTSIGDYTFYGCTSLTTIEMPNGLTRLSKNIFSGCSHLERITIPNRVESIGEQAFHGCIGLSVIEIPESVKSVDLGAFHDTAWYNNQPDGLIYAGRVAYAYKGTMSGNTGVVLKEGTLGIASGAFADCEGLKNIMIPSGVTNIGEWAFSGCTKLTSVIIPESVTSIGEYAFSSCTSLSRIAIPNTVTSIGNDAFDNTIWYNNQPDGLVYAGKVVYTYKGNKDLRSSNISVKLMDGTRGIAPSAFNGCTGLTSIIIPQSVTNIGDYAFYGCKSLTSIEIPSSVTIIGEYAFGGCTGLTSIEIPSSVTRIGWLAFLGCTSLAAIYIPKGSREKFEELLPEYKDKLVER